MTYNIRKAAVIGSGTMGGGIAALLAGIGVDTVLLDIPAKDTKPGDSPAKRNAIVNDNLTKLQKMRPAQLFSAADLARIRTGNLDDDLEMVADADWVIEVVVERLDVKRSLMAKLAETVRPDTIITSNTSGLPIKAIAEGLGDEFSRRFLGTHFFNPPRYLYLLEVIPHENTDPEIVEFISEFGKTRLGKGVVICKDRPNFIGNRFMSMSGMQTMNYVLDNGLTVEEVDALTGPTIGRPKTATFRLNDLVGFDIAVHVAQNLYPAIPEDPAREVLAHPKSTALSERMLKEGRLGNKTGQGFYKEVRVNGKREFHVLNLDTFEYEAPKNPTIEIVGKHRKVKNLGERIKALIAEPDKYGQFLFHIHAFYLAYASHRVPEITDTIVNVDNAQKWGFSHEMGPFEIWDALGVAETIPQFEAAGYPVAQWVKDMVAKGCGTFYRRDANGLIDAYYDQGVGDYVALPHDKREIKVAALKAAGKRIAGNSGASIIDLGDGVGLWEFHSQALAIDADLVEIGYKAADMLESGQLEALVVGHDGERFCIGANVGMVMFAVGGGALDQLEQSINALQQLTQRLRYASRPVVTAPFNMALGGGTELAMSGAAIVAHSELYAGLVEIGVGLIPAGAGCKELLRRVLNPVMESHPNADPIPHLQKVFQNIATGKVSESAKQAQEMGILAPTDKIVTNRAQLIGAAKAEALALAENYQPRTAGKIYAAGRDTYAALLLGIEGFRDGGYATDYDAHISKKLAYVLTGGALSTPQWVDEQLILDLEREAFMSLVGEAKTMERIQYMLQNNKPLRN
jgi:3-hydroxyacyl-CoA dehydrogenase